MLSLRRGVTEGPRPPVAASTCPGTRSSSCCSQWSLSDGVGRVYSFKQLFYFFIVFNFNHSAHIQRKIIFNKNPEMYIWVVTRQLKTCNLRYLLHVDSSCPGRLSRSGGSCTDLYIASFLRKFWRA